MSPQRKRTPKVYTTEAIAAVAAPSTPRVKRSRTSAAVAAADEAVEEKANNSTHEDIVKSDTRPSKASLLENH